MPDGHVKLQGVIEPGILAEVLHFLSSQPDRAGFLHVASGPIEGRIWHADGARSWQPSAALTVISRPSTAC